MPEGARKDELNKWERGHNTARRGGSITTKGAGLGPALYPRIKRIRCTDSKDAEQILARTTTIAIIAERVCWIPGGVSGAPMIW